MTSLQTMHPFPESSAETSIQSQQHPQRNKQFFHTQMLHGTGIFTYIWLNFVVKVGNYPPKI